MQPALLYAKSDIVSPMEWAFIRAHYVALYQEKRRAGVTQKAIAEKGGLAGQSSISKLLSNSRLGPPVGTFVKAVAGLDKDLVEFFAEVAALELSSLPSSSLSSSIASSTTSLTPGVPPPPSATIERPVHVATPLSPHELVAFGARFAATLDHMATLIGTHRTIPHPSPRVRKTRRRRTRRMA